MDWTELEPKPPKRHAIGEDLSKLSIGELKELSKALAEEIARVQETIAAKTSSKDAAEAAFKR